MREARVSVHDSFFNLTLKVSVSVRSSSALTLLLIVCHARYSSSVQIHILTGHLKSIGLLYVCASAKFVPIPVR